MKIELLLPQHAAQQSTERLFGDRATQRVAGEPRALHQPRRSRQAVELAV
ncbi:hypothetical protein [Novosphingobium sp. BW1]|nr:hypothetical protein [Novosphingobium sp. BW1]